MNRCVRLALLAAVGLLATSVVAAQATGAPAVGAAGSITVTVQMEKAMHREGVAT